MNVLGYRHFLMEQKNFYKVILIVNVGKQINSTKEIIFFKIVQCEIVQSEIEQCEIM